MKTVQKTVRRKKIQLRLKKKIRGTSAIPRLSVFRSNREIYAQIIDDVQGRTLVAASSRDANLVAEGNKTEKSKAVGKLLAERAKAENIEKVVFDRAGYLYHGRVKALADGARENGLVF